MASVATPIFVPTPIPSNPGVALNGEDASAHVPPPRTQDPSSPDKVPTSAIRDKIVSTLTFNHLLNIQDPILPVYYTLSASQSLIPHLIESSPSAHHAWHPD